VTAPAATDRAASWARLVSMPRLDVLVIGGGATGLGIALDAAARGFTVACVEAADFASGTSSRATKLAHGGVRYLAQGDIGLVREALRERGAMLANAPHLAQPVAFVMPGYRWWEPGFYGAGLKAYDALAGARGLGPTEFLSPRMTRSLLPGVRTADLAGGVKYWDGQFDDARFAIALARTAAARGALLLNHAPVVRLLREGAGPAARVQGAVVRDAETGAEAAVRAACIVNATGVWVDGVRAMDVDDEAQAAARPRAALVTPSQGVHLVVDASFWPGGHALLVPKTADGRVLFAVPWMGHVVLGTTDTPRERVEREPSPLASEVGFVLGESARYLARAPRREDVRSVWVGLRPLVRPNGEAGEAGTGATRAVSREHLVIVGRSGLVSVTGGKWTTYRSMAEDVLDTAMRRGLLPPRPGGVTERLALVGAAPGRPIHEPPGEHLYGSEAAFLRTLPGASNWLWRAPGAGGAAPRGLSEAMVRFAARHEWARSVADVLARRSRLLFLDAAQAARCAEPVAQVLAEELGPGFDAARSAAEAQALAAKYAALP
jgi:glycerol-3-phosphate dehydrogenase